MRTKTFSTGSSQWSRILGIFSGIVLAVGICLWSPMYAAAITPGIPGGGIFELDGNAVQNNTLKDDWGTILYKGPNTINGTIVATTRCTGANCDANWPGVLLDPPGKSIFVQGSKDLSDITSWVCRDQAAPDKDELTNAYGVAYNVNGELVVVLGADRFDNSGSATMGFWLLQSAIIQPACQPAGNGLFKDSLGNAANHAVGDLLVVADFTNGGAIGTIRVFKWVGSGGSAGSLDVMFDSGGSPNVDCANNQAGDICGTINQAPVASPWTYVPKGSSGDSDFIRFGFMEIGVNLSRLFGSSSLVPCFSTFVAETRSSDQANAAQKDFVLGSFNVCSIGVSKVCSNNQPNLASTPVTFTYDVGGCFTNTGFGSVTAFALSDSPDPLVNLKFYRPASGDAASLTDQVCDGDLGTLSALAVLGTQIGTNANVQPGERIIWLANFTSTVNGQHDTVTATAHSSGGGPALAPATDTATCPSRQFNPGINVTKNCSVFLEATGTELVVKSTISGVVCNTGDTPLNNVTVVDTTAGGTPGADMPNPILHINQLPAQANPAVADCTETSPSAASYHITYTPNILPTGANATRNTFVDDVTATGTPPTGTGVAQQATAHAVCSLCPECPSCVTTTNGPQAGTSTKPHGKK